MMVQVWLIYKKGEPRVYTRTTEPDEFLAKEWKRQGFKLYRGNMFIPEEDNTPLDGSTAVEVKEVESKDGE